jgi:ribosomal protein S18 acetylase RimI-like enzyme
MNIRKATPEDAFAIARVHVNSWQLAYRGLLPDERLDKLDPIRGTQHFHETITREPETFYIAEGEDSIIGVMALGPCRDQEAGGTSIGEVYALYLAPTHWRRGIGSVMMSEAELLLKAGGYFRVVLWTFEGNERARVFYEAVGYVTDGAPRLFDQVGASVNCIRYGKDL